MNKRVLGLLLACVSLPMMACGKQTKQADYLTPDDVEPGYYTSEEELPENAYYIMHKAKDDKGKPYVKYMPLLAAENNYGGLANESYTGFNPKRITWVNYNVDEGAIPTLSKNDKLIYKSSTYIPTKYALEKFFDEGYTFGVAGLKADNSGNYAYVNAKNNGSGCVLSSTNAAGFDGIEADSIYFVGVGKTPVTEENVSPSGTITGLKLMKTYPCDVRVGTEKLAADLTCNAHYFSSAETYLFGSFHFLTDVIAEIDIPEYATAGYYTIGNPNATSDSAQKAVGLFKYSPEKKFKNLSQEELNKTIYTYEVEDDSVRVIGTTIGLTFDKMTGFLVEPALDDDEAKINLKSGVEYKDISSSASDKTSTFSGTYTVKSLPKPVVVENGVRYEGVQVADASGDGFSLNYDQNSGADPLEVGVTYDMSILFKNDSYELIRAVKNAVQAPAPAAAEGAQEEAESTPEAEAATSGKAGD